MAALPTNDWTVGSRGSKLLRQPLHGGFVMMRRAILSFATLIALSQTAAASVPFFGHVSCSVVRFYVAKYSEPAAERWARSHGASDAEIETARHCLHSANVQAASQAAAPQAPAPVAEQERVRDEPAEHNRNQDALRVVAVEDQRAVPEQDKHENEPAVQGSTRPKDSDPRSAGQMSDEAKDRSIAPSDRKTTMVRPHYIGAMHRAIGARGTGHVAWLKRLWDQLTRPRRFNVAFLHFRGGRR